MRGANRDHWLGVLLLGWATLAVASLWLRPLWPVDETRYLSVAWEMWLRDDLLVPYLNGQPYSDKPPLLFWLMHLGWAVFGVNEWWPRLVAPLCACAALPLTRYLGRLLWPDAAEVSTYAVWVLFGTLLFAAFATLTMFDLLLMLCVMVAMVGILRAARGETQAGLLWLGAGIGLGILAKGPVILLHVLPVAVSAPWWAPALRKTAAKWYLGLLGAVLLGVAIALAWALPAGYFGGEQYWRAIFWGQTAGRVAESFAHRAPWWYYVPLLPGLLSPWLLWPALWRGLRAAGSAPGKMGVRFLTAWLALTVIGFSLVSGKQVKYLLPMVPAFALLAGYALAQLPAPSRWRAMMLPACGFLVLAAALAYSRVRPSVLELPDWTATLPIWPIIVPLLAVPLLLAASRRDTLTQVRALTFAMLAGFAVIIGGVMPSIAPDNDPYPTAEHLAALQRQNIPLAHLGKYHAQYNFAGRLQKPIEILHSPALAKWVAKHPSGQVVLVARERYAGDHGGPEYEGPFRGVWIQVWRGNALLASRLKTQ